MMVTVIRPGRLVEVEPDRLTADDIFDFAAALIENHGWMQGESGDANHGWSLHGAIGEAARRATRSGSKDYGTSRTLRDQADALIRAKYELSDIQLNDSCATAEEAVQKMLDAKGTAA